MTKRTTINDAILIEDGQDLERIVKDKRAQWRANNAKARRRQRHIKRSLLQNFRELSPIFIAHIPKMKPKALS